MNPADLTSEHASEGRISRVLGSTFCLGFVLAGIVGASRELQIPSLYGLVAFLGYAILSSFLIVLIVARLYRQHEVREIKFDMANLIFISVQLALPFALANAFWNIFQMELAEEIVEVKTRVILTMAGLAAFLLFPIFFLTEALLAWYNLFTKIQRRDTK